MPLRIIFGNLVYYKGILCQLDLMSVKFLIYFLELLLQLLEFLHLPFFPFLSPWYIQRGLNNDYGKILMGNLLSFLIKKLEK